MEINKRTLTISLLATVIFLSVPILGFSISRIWQRTFSGNPFTVSIEDPSFLTAFCTDTWDHYQSKSEVSQLLNGKTMIVITKNTYTVPLYLDLAYFSTAPEAVVSCTGKYVALYWSATTKVINGDAVAFNIPMNGTAFLLDSSQMMWKDPAPTASIGYALELTFTLDKSDVPMSGNYTYDITVGLST